MKVSIIIPVYYNEDNLRPLYTDIKEKFIEKIDYDYEIVMVNDGSKDKSYEVMQELAKQDSKVRIYSLARNFGSHAATLCGLSKCTGDCAVIKAADMQEPTELINEMVESWKTGNNVVLAVREAREESIRQTAFSNLYYWMVRKTALPNMPKMGFDVYLLDRKAINNLLEMNERNSSLSGQILWSGFRTGVVYYTRKARTIGTSKWTLKKKIRLVADSLYSFSTIPIKIVTTTGFFSFVGALIWSIVELISKLMNKIPVPGWTTLFIFNLFSFGVIMVSIGILGEYMWRTFDASRNRPTFILEDEGEVEKKT